MNYTEKTEGLIFYFTENSFQVEGGEDHLSESALSWKREFIENRFLALYHLGFVE